MIKSIKSPPRLHSVLISLCLILLLTYVGQDILIPVAMAMMFAILLRPVVVFLQTKLRFPQILAVSVSVIFVILVVAGIIYFISFQLVDIASDWVKIKANLMVHYTNLQQWVKDSFGVSFRDQKKYIQQAGKDSLEGGPSMIGSTLNSFTDTLLNMVLVPFYTFLILLYRNLFIVFILKFFKDEPESMIHQILVKVKTSVQSFLTGTMIEMLIVSGLTTVGLMIIGMKYAILLGVITGVLNLIPYIGILVAALLTIVATLTSTAELTTIAGVVVVNIIVQFLDNNILVPMVVSSKVKINAFMSIIVILIGGQLWGVAGMFLAIPAAAMLKIIFDQVEYLEPWGFLIGDDIPKTLERDALLPKDTESANALESGTSILKSFNKATQTIGKTVKSLFR